MNIRTRFAPSPTGHVHIGNIRAALFNWLYARRQGGQFLLRVEDTDRERSTPEAVQAVLDALAWLGLNPDEAPVFQSVRLQAHRDAAERLLRSGHAYKEDKGGAGKGECTIFRMPGKDMAFHDEIKGDLRKKAKDMKDFVIVRSDGSPVFHLANVVDDIDMGITHVIRGDDHVENTFRHIALYEALGADVPRFGHLPMIVNAQGKPYSKRDGAAYVGEFREKGYLADALFNYLALLGWSPGDDREILSREELVGVFTLERVQSSPARMDFKKLDWMNAVYVRALPMEERERKCRAAMEAAGAWREDIDSAYFRSVIEVMGERIHFFTDIVDQAGFFFDDDFPYDEKAVKKNLGRDGALEGLRAVRDRLAEHPSFDAASTEHVVHALAEASGSGMGAFVHPLRAAVSGMTIGPGLFEMLEVLGRERVLSRIDRTLGRFAVQ